MTEAASTSGSDLTMGTSVTFAGNPVVAMRRMREESSSPQKESNVITNTLDFGRNLENKSLEEVKTDLKNWNLEAAVAKLRKNSLRHKGACGVHVLAYTLNAPWKRFLLIAILASFDDGSTGNCGATANVIF